MVYGHNALLPDTPETAAVVIDYLKEQFKDSQVPSVPIYEGRREVYTFKVNGPDRSYHLEISRECLDDFSASELQDRLRKYRTCEAMRRSATRRVILTVSRGVFSLPPKS